MATCPFAVQRRLPEDKTQPRAAKRLAILHTQGFDDNDGTLYDDFNRSGNSLESTFFIRWDGTIEQYLDTEVRADANRYANSFAVSIETEDDGGDIAPWSDAQVVSIIRLLRWLNSVHPDIVLTPTKTWDGKGIGYHVMFGAPSPWTPVAKSCPGKARIDQFWNVIVPALASPPPPSPEEEDEDMQPKIIWYKDAVGVHAYQVLGLHGKHLNESGLALAKKVGVPEHNTPQTALDYVWQSTVILVDGPCKNV